MSELREKRIFEKFGFTEKESDLYTYLAKNGIQKGGDIAEHLKIHKSQAYRILKSLESKGAVEATLENPKRFTAVTFSRIIDLNIKAKQIEAGILKNNKKSLIDNWKKNRNTKNSTATRKIHDHRN